MSVRRWTVVLQPAARRDVRSILRFSAETWGPAQRDKYRAAIDQALTTLSRSPHIGRLRDEIGPGLRSHRVEQHIIYYRLRADTVTILRILHQKMDGDQHVENP